MDFVGPDSNIGDNRCDDCEPTCEDWACAWDNLRRNIQAERGLTPGNIHLVLEWLDAFDPR